MRAPGADRRGRALVLAVLATIGAAPGSAWAVDDDDSLFSFFKGEVKVVTASRRPQAVRDAPVSIDVITADEIRAQGATDLWTPLRFRVGIDVLDGRANDGNRAVVSVRGFPQAYVENLQVLVDGRSVYSLSSGGVSWDQIPVQLQDVERIEVVRGPNAALYGSNAGLGVINIITRRPRASLSATGQVGYGSYGQSRAEAAAEDRRGPVSLRFSYGYSGDDGFPVVPDTPFGVSDDQAAHRANLRALYQVREGLEVEVFGGGSWQRFGLPWNRSGRVREGFAMAKATQRVGTGSAVDVLVSQSLSSTDDLGDVVRRDDYAQTDVEATHRFSTLDETFQLVSGGAYRRASITSPSKYQPATQWNDIWRGFAQPFWRVSNRVSLAGAIAAETSRTGGFQPAFQAAGIVTPDDAHTLRLAYSLAPTLPPIYDWAARQRTSSATYMLGSPSLGAEHLHNIEAGWIGSLLARRLRLEATAFLMLARDIVTAGPAGDPQPPDYVQVYSFTNANQATAMGAELRVIYRLGAGQWLQANYTFEKIEDRLGLKPIYAGTPLHKVNINGTFALGHGLAASVDAGFKTAYTFVSITGTQTDVPAYLRLDARLAWRAAPQVETFVAGHNLLSALHVEASDFHEVPRSVFAGVSFALP